MARKRTLGYVQLEWTCPNCDTRNPGSAKTCVNCGAPQPENVQFERPAEDKFVTDRQSIEAAQAGADIHCGFCGTRNPAAATVCSQCGADLTQGRARSSGRVMQASQPGPKTVLCTNCGAENPASEQNCSKCGSPLPRAAQTAQTAARKPAVKKKTNWRLIGGIGGALLLCCVAVLFLFVLPTASVQGTVTDIHWQTSVPVQEQREVHYSDERGNPPSDAYNVSCRTETRQVCEQRTIDQGNGYAEVVEECRDESLDYCSYDVKEWQTIQTYTLEGSDLFPAYSSPNISADQRLGSKSEDLTVYFDTETGRLTYTPGSVHEFQQFEMGSVWTLKLNAVGSVLSAER